MTAAEIDATVRKAASANYSHRQIERLRRMLAGLKACEVTGQSGDALARLCTIGVSYAWRELERTIAPEPLGRISPRAQVDLRRYLQGTLEWISRPCFELEWKSFGLALDALGLGAADDRSMMKKFLGSEPGARLFSFFRKFPVLAGLWSICVYQWCDQVAEVLARVATDKRSISRTFFDGSDPGRIKNIRLGLSDRHNGGRSVTLIEFNAGRVIYKPRSGRTEAAWFSLLRSMNANGFRPPLRAARVLRRKNYCWMEYIEPAACANAAAVGRFYKRLGALIAGAHLLKTVDCHRENLIAAGEDPVLVDVDALWHVSPLTKTQAQADVLYRTGFFPNSNPESLQSRSSVFGQAHGLPGIGNKRTTVADYTPQIIAGFTEGWRRLLGIPARQSAFRKRMRRLSSQERRWIYMATEKYAAIIRASLQPSALTSGRARSGVIRRLCTRPSVSTTVVQAEINALIALDIPYFLRRTHEQMPPEKPAAPPEIVEAIRQALQWTVKRSP